MLSNIESVENLRSLARLRGQSSVVKTVGRSSQEDMLAQGWDVERENEKSVRLKKEKTGDAALVDRVWTLLYRMGFLYVNGDGSALLTADLKVPGSQTTTIDVVGVDMEVGLAIWCRSSEEAGTRPSLRQELDQYILTRQRFAQSVNQQFPFPLQQHSKRQVALAVFTSKIFLSDDERKRAREGNIMFFEEEDLAYYEALVSHLGPAARYQFLGDMLPHKLIPGLNLRVPAIRTRMGVYTCYTFSIPPEYLLKIAYVSHRSKGKKSDIDTYQRMIQKSRLQKIREYLDKKNIFPTNIVVTFDGEKPLDFHRSQQETEQESGVMGWLDIRCAYKSAWIIDGQHRLFAYSGHPQAAKARLSVLAFEKLPPSTQAQLFVDINAEQKSVKQSLLQELYAGLHENATEPEMRVRAIISQAILSLGSDPDSAFYQRIQAADEKKDEIRCISFTSLFRALDSDFYMSGVRKEGIPDYGPLWDMAGNDATRIRTVYILKEWFGVIRAAAPEWWDVGSGEGGGLAMNDGVTACTMVLRSVFRHLSAKGKNLLLLSDEKLFDEVRPYAEILSNYLASLPEEGRRQFRALRGSQGQITRARRCEQAIQESVPEFSPPGLREFMEREKAQTNLRAKVIIDEIERTLQKTIIEVLKRVYGSEESQWWMVGVPLGIRVEAVKKYEFAGGDRGGGKENYLNFIDYKEIIGKNWDVFSNIFGRGKANAKKEVRLAWLQKVNDLRNIVAHSSSGRSVEIEQLRELEEYGEWLRKQIKNARAHEEDPEGEVPIQDTLSPERSLQR
jgi:DNA sulfur modification protein DndB